MQAIKIKITALAIVFCCIGVSFARGDLCVADGEPKGFTVVNSAKGYTLLLNDNNKAIKKLPNGTISDLFSMEGNGLCEDWLNGGNVSGKDVVSTVSYKKIPVVARGEGFIKFSDNFIRVTIKTQAYKKKEHVVVSFNTEGVRLLNNEQIYGVFEENDAVSQYQSIEVSFGLKTIKLPEQAIANFFEPPLNYQFDCPFCDEIVSLNEVPSRVSYDRATKTLFIEADNGEAAEVYSVLWVVKDKQYQRKYASYRF